MKKLSIVIALIFIMKFSAHGQCWKMVDGGADHTVAIKNDGTLWVWGRNNENQLGTGISTDINNPTKIGEEVNWSSVSAGLFHTIAVKSDGTLWSWGKNNNGQLGDNTTYNKSRPLQIGTANDWKMVSAGGYFTMAIKKDGTLWGWGANYDGSLGIGTSIETHTPSQVGTERDWTFISAGGSHCMALKSDGSLWTWGTNYYGELGNSESGHSKSQHSPIKVNNATDWKMICAGNGYSMAIKNDGTLWTWGINGFGQLGDGSTDQKNIPMQVGTDKDWKSVAGYVHTMAVKTNGTLWACGSNQYGQYGNNNTVFANGLEQVGILKNWQFAAVGYQFSVLLQNDASLWATGENKYGQLGNHSSNSDSVYSLISCYPARLLEAGCLFNFITIAPNPFNSEFVFEFGGKHTKELVINNIFGKEIYRTTLSPDQSKHTINALDWPGGLYLYRINSEGVVVKSGKLIKN